LSPSMLIKLQRSRGCLRNAKHTARQIIARPDGTIALSHAFAKAARPLPHDAALRAMFDVGA
jgi:hypothetical protein